MSNDFEPSIDVEAVFAGLADVRSAAPETPFATWPISLVGSASAATAFWDFVGAVEKVRAAMVRESEILANEVTVIALNACRADQLALEQANATVTGTTTSTTGPTTTPTTTTTPTVDPPAQDVTPTQTTTSPTTTTTTVPPAEPPS